MFKHLLSDFEKSRQLRKLRIPAKHFLTIDYNKQVCISIAESVATLTRCSFDERYREPIISYGGIQSLAELVKVFSLLTKNHLFMHYFIQAEHAIHSASTSALCNEVRRYAVVALTNLTFGNTNIKSYLCTLPSFIACMVDNLEAPVDNLSKATSHLFRNLAWKADKASKLILSDSGVVKILISNAMRLAAKSMVVTQRGRSVEPGKDEQSLKVMLSGLWNLSAHNKKNKADICEEKGSLIFLVEMLRSSSETIVENGGGILRNISSHIASSTQGDLYR